MQDRLVACTKRLRQGNSGPWRRLSVRPSVMLFSHLSCTSAWPRSGECLERQQG